MQESLSDMISGYNNMALKLSKLLINTSDACVIRIPTSAVDYIFTDPPYAEKVQYGELNFIS